MAKNHRRDRRKAKASGWKREGKASMNGNKVAHGTVGPGKVHPTFDHLEQPSRVLFPAGFYN